MCEQQAAAGSPDAVSAPIQYLRMHAMATDLSARGRVAASEESQKPARRTRCPGTNSSPTRTWPPTACPATTNTPRKARCSANLSRGVDNAPTDRICLGQLVSGISGGEFGNGVVALLLLK